MVTTLIPQQLFDGNTLFENRPISFENGKIVSFDTVKGAKEIKVDGLLTAGFIDAQVNGGGGVLFNHQPTADTLTKMVKAHAQFGTTSLLPTLITSDLATIEQASSVISQAIQSDLPGVVGVHFEGPHISNSKKGIHSSEYIRPLSEQELALYCRDDLGIKVLTVAPETVSTETIKTLVAHDVIVCLGHSNANFAQTCAALDAGATGFTHLFNAMSPLTSREPNMVGAALLNENSWCGLILDGFHVHPDTARLAVKAKQQGKTFLVTDAMSTIGSLQQALEFDGHKISLASGKLTSLTGQLAGSALDMVSAVNNARCMLQIDLPEALRMASLYAADFLQKPHVFGQLSIGANADFTLLSTKQAECQVHSTWINGKQIF